MAVRKKIKKIDLHSLDVLINDKNTSSKFFNVSGVPEEFPIGKSFFKIAGSNLLRPGSEVRIEILHHAGGYDNNLGEARDPTEDRVIYHEPLTGYLDGRARLVTVWFFKEDVLESQGQVDCTLSIVG